MKGLVSLLFLFFLMPAYGQELPGKGHDFSRVEWGRFLEQELRADFSDDPEIIQNTIIQVWDVGEIICKVVRWNVDKPQNVIIVSRGFLNIVSSKEAVMFFLAHEVGHVKTDFFASLVCNCDEQCEQLAADRFAMDLMESKGVSSCDAKRLLLIMGLEYFDRDEKRLKQLQENCPLK